VRSPDAGEPEDRQRVASVGLHVVVEHDVGGEGRELRPDRCVRLEDEDAVRISAEAELVTRAEHPLALRARDRGDLDAPVAGQDRSRERHRHPLARRDVGRTADDRELGPAVPDADAGQRKPCRTGVRRHLDELTDDDVLPLGADAVDRADLHPEEREALRELLGRQLDRDELPEPGEGDAHR
jgi:hypothetical protein